MVWQKHMIKRPTFAQQKKSHRQKGSARHEGRECESRLKPRLAPEKPHTLHEVQKRICDHCGWPMPMGTNIREINLWHQIEEEVAKQENQWNKSKSGSILRNEDEHNR